LIGSRVEMLGASGPRSRALVMPASSICFAAAGKITCSKAAGYAAAASRARSVQAAARKNAVACFEQPDGFFEPSRASTCNGPNSSTGMGPFLLAGAGAPIASAKLQ